MSTLANKLAFVISSKRACAHVIPHHMLSLKKSSLNARQHSTWHCPLYDVRRARTCIHMQHAQIVIKTMQNEQVMTRPIRPKQIGHLRMPKIKRTIQRSPSAANEVRVTHTAVARQMSETHSLFFSITSTSLISSCCAPAMSFRNAHACKLRLP